MSIDEVLRKARKEIWGCVASSDKKFVVELAMGLRAYCLSLVEASEICRKFVAMHGVSAAIHITRP